MSQEIARLWKTRSRRLVLNCGKFLKVELHTVALPDGRLIEDWPWVVTPDFVNVVAETAEGDFLCFRQVKYAVQGMSLAPVGGYLEPGEAPLSGAQRELLEETGYDAPDWVSLGSYPVDGNRGAGNAHFFLARGARRASAPIDDDIEEQELVRLSRTELAAALTAAQFKALPWSAIIALALLHLGAER